MAGNLSPSDILSGTGLGEPAAADSPLIKMGILVTEPFEQFYGAVGAREPWQRFALGFSLSSLLMFLTEPSWAYDEAGRARPWSVMSNGQPNATPFHWSILPIAFGVASAIFI